jgi:hypothetical protein
VSDISFKEFVNLFTKEVKSLVIIENGKKYKLTSYGNTAIDLLSKYHTKMYLHVLYKKYDPSMSDTKKALVEFFKFAKENWNNPIYNNIDYIWSSL